MEFLIEYAWALLARTHRYHWGGDDPILGFDCSGYIMELLMAAGEIPHATSKMSAQMLYNHFEKNGSFNTFGAGAIAFYGKDALHITHVAFCLDGYSMLEAAGGDSSTLTDEVAVKKNAFVKLRPIKYRKDFFCSIKPKYIQLGMLS